MKKIVLALSALGLLSTAFANGGYMPAPCPVQDLTGFLIGIEGGYGYLGTSETNLYNQPNFYNVSTSFLRNQIPSITTTISNTYNESHKIGDFVWGAHIGYDFQFRPDILLGVEAGYKDFGKSYYKSSNCAFCPPRRPLWRGRGAELHRF